MLIPIGQIPSSIVGQVIEQYKKRSFICSRNGTHIIVSGAVQMDFEPCIEHDASKHIFMTAYELSVKFKKWVVAKKLAVEKITTELKENVETWYCGSMTKVECILEDELADLLVKIYTKNGFKCSAVLGGLVFSRKV